MRLRRRHSWAVSPADAIALQKELRGRVVADRPIDLDRVRLVAGVDVRLRRAPKFRLPEPIRLAHRAAGRFAA